MEMTELLIAEGVRLNKKQNKYLRLLAKELMSDQGQTKS